MTDPSAAHSGPLSDVPVRRALVVSKKTTYQLDVVEKKDPHLLKLLAEGSPAARKLERTHSEHLDSLAVVSQAFRDAGFQLKVIDRSELFAEPGGYDIVASFGGDGTFLECARMQRGAALLGINSATFSSHGHWCLASKDNIAAVLAGIVSGERKAVPVMRLEVSINGKALPELAVNEVFISHPSPAGTSRYSITVRGVSEDQRSSGVLVGPAAGSTGWMRTAGGKVLPVASSQFQLLVREPCEWPGESFAHKHLVLEREEEVRVVPIMAEGRIYIDGANVSYSIARGDEVVVRPHAGSLPAYLSLAANEGY